MKPEIGHHNAAMDRPRILEIEPTNYCNLRCKCCHMSFDPPQPSTALDLDLLDQCQTAAGARAIVGSVFEPTVHPQFGKLIDWLEKHHLDVELITSATTLNNSLIERLRQLRLRFLTLSFDGITPSTYEQIRRGARFNRTMDNVLSLRDAFTRRDTFFLLNYTLMRSNLDELIPALHHWDKAGMDAMNVIIMVLRSLNPEVIQESLFPVREKVFALLDSAALDVIHSCRRISIRNPHFRDSPSSAQHPTAFSGMSVKSAHPEARHTVIHRVQVQLGSVPGMPWPCRSPFVLARILANGDVQLCYKHVVGNLRENTLDAIWFGPKSATLRQRLMRDDSECRCCDYYRFALQEENMNLEDPANYFAEHLVPLASKVDFVSGQCLETVSPPPPQLIESIGGFNIVQYDHRFYGLPQELGPVEIDKDNIKTMQGVIIANTLQQVRNQLQRQ